jgi:hypothetical protein
MKKKSAYRKPVRTVLTAEGLKKAPLKKFVGREVEIRLVEAEPEDPVEALTDYEEIDRLTKELEGDDEDLTFEEMDRLTSGIQGSWAQDIIEARKEERF